MQLGARRVHAVVLAAGGSSRLGAPKQLARVGGEALVRRVARLALEGGADGATVVLGADAERVRLELEGLRCELVLNDRWREGLGTSIAAGVGSSPNDASGLLIALCDQIEVTSEHLQKLMDTYRAGADLVASSYAGTLGVPAVFSPAHRVELLRLAADEGAKSILRRGTSCVAAVPFEGGEIDVDTPADLARLR